MSRLPVCRWRKGKTVEGFHRCRSPKLVHGPHGVQDTLCFTCVLRDHPRLSLLAILRFRFLQAAGLSQLVIHRVRLFFRFGQALYWHTLAGLPQATKEEQRVRLAVCKGCWQYDRINQVCNVCECRLKDTSFLPNKIRWAKEQCPLYDPKKHTEPHHLWGPVKGEKIWTRWWRGLMVLFGFQREEKRH